MHNVFIERVWRSLKHEDIYLKGYADGCEAKAGIAGWIAFYNEQRLHQALGHRTPMAVWRAAATTADDSPCGMIKAERSGRLLTKRSVQAVPLGGSTSWCLQATHSTTSKRASARSPIGRRPTSARRSRQKPNKIGPQNAPRGRPSRSSGGLLLSYLPSTFFWIRPFSTRASPQRLQKPRLLWFCSRLKPSSVSFIRRVTSGMSHELS
jgi:hypothetical protein